MATVYLPVTERLNLTSEQRAKGISRELYNLKLPKHLHEPGRTTTMLLATIQHPDTGQWACIADTELTFNVHPLCEPDDLIALLPELSVQEQAFFVNYINSNKGLTISLNDCIPSHSLKLTEEEAKSLGWINDDLNDE
jgi:hypothetical protein